MKKVFSVLALAAALIAGVSCQKVDDLEGRVDGLETTINSLNKTISLNL